MISRRNIIEKDQLDFSGGVSGVGGMDKSDARPGIAQLMFQRKWLEAQLGSGSLGATEEATLVSDLEKLDLKIAATRCDTVEDLGLKLERLADLLWPFSEPMPEDCIEHVMLASVIRDAAALTAHQ